MDDCLLQYFQEDDGGGGGESLDASSGLDATTALDVSLDLYDTAVDDCWASSVQVFATPKPARPAFWSVVTPSRPAPQKVRTPETPDDPELDAACLLVCTPLLTARTPAAAASSASSAASAPAVSSPLSRRNPRTAAHTAPDNTRLLQQSKQQQQQQQQQLPPPPPPLLPQPAQPALPPLIESCPECLDAPLQTVKRMQRRVCSLAPWCAVSLPLNARATAIRRISIELCLPSAGAEAGAEAEAGAVAIHEPGNPDADRAALGSRETLENAVLRVTVPAADADWMRALVLQAAGGEQALELPGVSADLTKPVIFVLPRATETCAPFVTAVQATLRQQAATASDSTRDMLTLLRAPPASALRLAQTWREQLCADDSECADRLRQLGLQAPGLRRLLKPYQLAAVHFAVRRKGRILLADDMGLGKTVQAIAIAMCYHDEWPLLVLAPASCRRMWCAALEQWLPFLSPTDIRLIYGSGQRLSPMAARLPKVVVTSYAMARRLSSHAECSLAAFGFKVVILDECHVLSTSTQALANQQTRAVLELLHLAPRAILLSGTPVMSKPLDMFHPLDALVPGLLGTSVPPATSATVPATTTKSGSGLGGGGGSNNTSNSNSTSNNTSNSSYTNNKYPPADARHAFAASYLRLRPDKFYGSQAPQVRKETK